MIRSDVAYLADIFEKLNIVNKQLQGNNTTLIQAKGVVLSFLSKLTLFRQNIARREFGHLPCLRELDMAKITALQMTTFIFTVHILIPFAKICSFDSKI